MKNRYTLLLEKYRRFHDWEIRYHKQIPMRVHLENFVKLYQTKQSMNPGMIQKIQQEHLDALVQTQKRLKLATASSESKGC